MREAIDITKHQLASAPRKPTDVTSEKVVPGRREIPSATEQPDAVRHLTLVPPPADDQQPARPRRMRATIACLLAAGIDLPLT